MFGIGSIGSIGGESSIECSTAKSSLIHVQQSQLHYKDTLYKLGILEQRISTLQSTIKKLSKKSSRRPSVGIITTSSEQQRHRLKNEIQQYKRELTKAESEMITTRKSMDAQLRTLFLIKLEGELVELEDGVKRKKGEVKKWEVVLRRAEMEIEKSCSSSSSRKKKKKSVEKDDDGDDDCESSSSSSSSSGCSSSVESGVETEDDDEEECYEKERMRSNKSSRKTKTRTNERKMVKQKKGKKMGRKTLFHR